jgi:putative phage-type endonuclease
MNNEQFLLDRKTGIGGSDISAILGINPWKTALDVYFDKVADEIVYEQNDNMERGRKLEEYVLKEYSDRNSTELEIGLEMERDKQYSCLIAHYDAKIKDRNVIVEAKSSKMNPFSWGNVIPAYYRTQVAHYAAIADCEYVDVAVLFNQWQYAQFTYYRDEEYEKYIRKTAVDFWNNHVLKKIPPQPQNLEEVKKVYTKANLASSLKANDIMKNAVQELKLLEEDKKNIEHRLNTVKAYIMQTMEENEILEDEEGKSLIVWRNSTRRLFDTNAFKENHIDLYNKFVKNVESRTFRIT